MTEICGICLDGMDNSNQGQLLPCKHSYHVQCIRNWHLHSKDFKCPTCRKDSSSLYRFHDDIQINLKYWSNISLIDEFSKLIIHQEEEEKEKENDEVQVVQCALCGDMDNEVNIYCEVCETLFHPSCINELLCEVGQSEWCCTECQGRLQGITESRLSSRLFKDSNERIFCGRMRDRRSILTECIYKKFRKVPVLSYEDKCKIQTHVREELDRLYQVGILTKEKYTEINKKVSRQLYEISNGEYNPDKIDYLRKAKYLIHQSI